MKQDEDLSLGIRCPVCESTERRVVESRRQINKICRRCICQTCSTRFTTTEKLIDRDYKVSPSFLFAVLKGLSSIEKAVSSLRISLETGLANYKYDDDR